MKRDFYPGEPGHAFIEILLILLILGAIAFCGLEFVRSLRHSQVAATLSREAASVAFRDCTASNTPVPCLDREKQQVAKIANSLFPGGEVIISLLTYDQITNKFVLVARSTLTGPYASKFGLTLPGPKIGTALTGILADINVVSAIKSNRTTVVAEVFLPYDAIVKGIPKMFSYDPDVFYDITIM